MKSSPSILLIEDDPAIAQMYVQKLEQAGFNVTHKPDGPSGWQALTEGTRPDLLLLDVVLPKRDGFEILRDIRRHTTLHDLKVMLLTNLAQEVDRVEGKKLGADSYVVKAHITPHELIEKVQAILKSSGSS